MKYPKSEKKRPQRDLKSRSAKQKQVHYGELSDTESEANIVEFDDDFNTSTDDLEDDQPGLSLNKPKQYNKVLTNYVRDDWEICSDKNIPKGCDDKDSYFLYVNLHPALFHLLVPMMAQFMTTKFNFKQINGKQDRY